MFLFGIAYIYSFFINLNTYNSLLMRNIFLYLLLFALSLSVGYAQLDSTAVLAKKVEKAKKKSFKKARKANRARYLQLGAGITAYHLQDFAVSPLHYKGILPTFKLSYEVKGDEVIWGAFINGAMGSIKSPRYGLPTKIYNPQIDFHYARKITKLTGKRIKTYLGGYAMYGGNIRINKGFFNTAGSFYDIVNSYGVTAKINSGFSFETKSFQWNNQGEVKKRFLALDFQLFIPLVHSYLRPDYAVVSNFPSTEAKITPSFKTTSWGKIARLTSQFDLTYFLKNNNAIRFSYRWDAYSVNPGFNREAVSRNSYLVSLLFRLNKKILE